MPRPCLNPRYAALILGLWFCVGARGHFCAAQARIDPSLPEAPVPYKRSFFIIPGYETVHDPNIPVPPLSSKQKFEMAAHKVFDPSYVIGAGISTTYDEAVGVGPRYGDGAAGVGKLYLYNAANLASTFFFTDALLPAAFHQDPRYFRAGQGTFASRTWWALRSNFVTYADTGREMPNYSSMLGFGMASALSNAYLPSQNISFGKTMEGWGIKEAVRFGTNLMREFGGASLIKKQMRRMGVPMPSGSSDPPADTPKSPNDN